MKINNHLLVYFSHFDFQVFYFSFGEIIHNNFQIITIIYYINKKKINTDQQLPLTINKILHDLLNRRNPATIVNKLQLQIKDDRYLIPSLVNTKRSRLFFPAFFKPGQPSLRGDVKKSTITCARIVASRSRGLLDC